MSQFDLDKAMNKLKSRGFDEYATELSSSRTEQVRFSRNNKDLYNIWDQSTLVIFASRGKRTVTTSVKDPDRLDSSIELLWGLAGKIPENPSFEGINPETQEGYRVEKLAGIDYDLHDLSQEVVNSSLEAGAERAAGVLYNRTNTIEVRTKYNQCTYTTGGLEVVIRSFKGNNTGQEGRHFGLKEKVDSRKIREIGHQSAEALSLAPGRVDFNPGKYDVLMSPYVIGNLMSYSSSFLSYYSVETGLSCFSESMNKGVSCDSFTLVDDPVDSTGVGYRACDDEATKTGPNVLIENGVLKNYMHSFSTSAHAGTKTTGNAGIISPGAWQLKVLPGAESAPKMISELDEGLLINNCWYTRYQDYRNAIFSTVPRDGVFYVKNGEIQGSVTGIRISDSIPNVLSGITGISRETKNVKWWEEIAASNMPYVLSEKIGITKSF